MTEPVIGMIWAQASNGVIGRGNAMPWHLREDFEHFRALTTGHPVIMGRRTWESLPDKSRPLPERTNIVITSNSAWAEDGALRATSLMDALGLAHRQDGAEQIWIIGGGRVYSEAVHIADTAVITMVDAAVEGDTFAPVLDATWSLADPSQAEGWNTAANGMRYRFETWTAT
jgi:dihydrofolate reductase